MKLNPYVKQESVNKNVNMWSKVNRRQTFAFIFRTAVQLTSRQKQISLFLFSFYSPYLCFYFILFIPFFHFILGIPRLLYSYRFYSLHSTYIFFIPLNYLYVALIFLLFCFYFQSLYTDIQPRPLNGTELTVQF